MTCRWFREITSAHNGNSLTYRNGASVLVYCCIGFLPADDCDVAVAKSYDLALPDIPLANSDDAQKEVRCGSAGW
jgi:hypothetical protein